MGKEKKITKQAEKNKIVLDDLMTQLQALRLIIKEDLRVVIAVTDKAVWISHIDNLKDLEQGEDEKDHSSSHPFRLSDKKVSEAINNVKDRDSYFG